MLCIWQCVCQWAVLTLSAPFIWVEHQPELGLLQLHLQPLVFALQLSDLLLPLLQHPQPGVKVEETLKTKQTQSQIPHIPADDSQSLNPAQSRVVYTDEGRGGLSQVERGAANLLWDFNLRPLLDLIRSQPQIKLAWALICRINTEWRIKDSWGWAGDREVDQCRTSASLNYRWRKKSEPRQEIQQWSQHLLLLLPWLLFLSLNWC